MSDDRTLLKWIAGTRKTLQVLRHKPPYGHFLGDGWREVLLPTAEQTAPLQIGGNVDVLVYHDSDDRWVATMRPSKLEYPNVAALTVVDIHPKFGVFLDLGIARHLLLPYRELPEAEFLRPRKGDAMFVRIDHDQMGRMIARAAGEQLLAEMCVPAPQTWRNQWVDAIVYNTMKIGTFVVCDAGVLGFGVIGMIHQAERLRPLRVGERLRLRVIFVREDGRVNLSMREPVHEARSTDAEKVYVFLMTRGGTMPYGDHTDPDMVRNVFQLTKGAFKRALGLLMREGKIRQENGQTIAVPQEEKKQ